VELHGRASRHRQARSNEIVDCFRSLRLETQYALQERIDSGVMRTRADYLSPAVRAVEDISIELGVGSILDVPYEQWSAAVAKYRLKDAGEAFLRRMWRLIDAVAAGDGWAGQYPRDQWDLRALGIGTSRQIRFLRFDAISQPWLRDLAKQHTRWRLSVEVSLSQVTRDLIALRRLSTPSTATRPRRRRALTSPGHILRRSWRICGSDTPPGKLDG